MKIDKQLVLLVALALCSTSASANEPPDDTIIEQVLQEAGFTAVDELAIERAAEFLQMKYLVYEERLSRSNVAVLKSTETYPTENVIPRYEEVIQVNVRGEPKLFARPMPPEEVQRREMEASALPAEQLAKGMKAYAAGAEVLGEVLRQEMENNPVGWGLAGPFLESHGNFEVTEALEQDTALCETFFDIVSDEEYAAAGAGWEVNPPDGVEVWTSINPAHFMLGPACMALFAGEVYGEIDAIDPETAKQIKKNYEKALAEVETVGIESVNGRPSVRLRIDDANLVQSLASGGLDTAEPAYGMARSEYATGGAAAAFHPSSDQQVTTGSDQLTEHEVEPAIFYYEDDGRTGLQPLVQRIQSKGGRSVAAAGTFAIHSIDLWIDAEYFVDRKLRMEGVMTENGQSKDVFIEQEWQDYRNVPNSALYEPYKRVMRAGGILTEAQQAELAEAQTQLAQYEREMASMPAAERAMVESMMGGQIEQMRNMVNGGAVEIEIITTSIEINPDFHNPMYEEFAREMGVAPVNAGGDDGLLQVIQVDLSTLGYEPGNTKGVLDTMTQVAISQFQAEAGLQVTGEPSTALAAALATAVGRK